MRWTVAGGSEVVERADDAGAEVVLPHAIDHDARRERMLRLDQPTGEREASARRFRAGPRRRHDERRLAVGEHGRHTGADEPGRLQVIAAPIDVRRARRAAIPQGADARDRLPGRFERLDLLSDRRRLRLEDVERVDLALDALAVALGAIFSSGVTYGTRGGRACLARDAGGLANRVRRMRL